MVQNRRRALHVFNILLAAVCVYLGQKILYAFSGQAFLSYIIFLFLFAALEYIEKEGVRNLLQTITGYRILLNLAVTVLLYRFYTYYEHKIYAVIWFICIFAILLVSDAASLKGKLSGSFGIGAFFLAFLYAVGWSFENSRSGDGLRRVLCNAALLAICWFVLFARCFLIGDHLLKAFMVSEPVFSEIVRRRGKKKTRTCFWICFFVNILIWIPVFLTFYPAVFNSDPVDQMQNILGLTPYSDHHPWYYTLFIGLCYKIGYFLFGTVNGGIAVYTIFSMIFSSAGFAFAVAFLYQKGLRWYLLVFVEMLYALDPIKAHQTMAMWKDIPFAVMLLILSVLLAGYQGTKKWFAAFCATALAICLVRHNGIYILILLLPVLWMVWRQDRRYLAGSYAFLLIAYFVIVKVVIPAAGVREIGLVHSFSIPLQQIGYTVCEDGNISEEEYALIHAVAGTEEIKEAYQDWSADYMKHLAEKNEDVIEQNKLQYLKLWASIGIKNPYCYLKSYVEITKGYWFPTQDLPVRMGDGVSGEEIGMDKHPLLLSQETADKINEMTWTYGCEIYPHFFCIGLWTYCSIAILVFLMKRRGCWLAVLPSLLSVVTLLIAVPLYAEFRYAYPTYCFVPFGIGLLLLPDFRAKKDIRFAKTDKVW